MIGGPRSSVRQALLCRREGIHGSYWLVSQVELRQGIHLTYSHSLLFSLQRQGFSQAMEFPTRNKKECVDSSTVVQGALLMVTNVFLHTGAPCVGKRTMAESHAHREIIWISPKVPPKDDDWPWSCNREFAME